MLLDSVGVHVTRICVKQWHAGFPQPGGQLHSEQRKRQPFG